MNVELVRTQTTDGLRLDGALHGAAQDSVSPELDAMICLSGVGSNFYSATLIERIVVLLNQKGIHALSVNTRGHDGVNTVSTTFGGRRLGAAYEVVDDCRHDVSAWIDFLVQRGHRRIGLLGHSLGAIKVLYSQACEPHDCVVSTIAVSPPRLSYSRFMEGPDADKFRYSTSQAQKLTGENQPKMLFQASFPFPLIISAETFLDKYGPEERYNVVRFVDRIKCKLTFIYGGAELTDGNSAFTHLDVELDRLKWAPARRPSIVTIPGANHFYSGHLTELLEEVKRGVGGG